MPLAWQAFIFSPHASQGSATRLAWPATRLAWGKQACQANGME